MAPLKERRKERRREERERKERKGGGYLGSLALKKGSTYAVPNVRRQDHSSKDQLKPSLFRARPSVVYGGVAEDLD